jgi:hypothetical protein
MSQIKNQKQFAELEYCIQHYFDGKISPVMNQVKADLNSKQTKELADYLKSPRGVLASSNPYCFDPTFGNLKATGEWNSKTTEDYIKMCNTKIQNSKMVQNDLAVIAEEWRSAVVKQIGRAKYDTLSAKLGCDLAYAYIGSRMEDLMVNKLVKDNMPKSSAEYIMRKAAQNSIWGLSNELMKSPLTREIEERGEKAYNPSKVEKGAGKVLGSAVDAVSLGGAGSWKAFASFVGSDLAINYIAGKVAGNSQQRKEMAMEVCISKGVFGSNANVFSGFRGQANKINASQDAYINNVNSKLKNKFYVPNPKYSFMALTKPTIPAFQFTLPTNKRDDPKYKNVPMIVAPGKEDQYLADKAKYDAAQKKAAEKPKAETTETAKQTETEEKPAEQTPTEQPLQTNSNGWMDMLANATGLNGFGDTFSNMGYTLAMLPDVLVGLFTGKTKSINIGNTMIPMAAIMTGLFVKNPILKTLLIVMGGANLVNKVGHEALDWQKQDNESLKSSSGAARYKAYPDEPLNGRISNPVLKGNCLVATIDNIPCTIQLTDNVVGAYQSGALPLNTLANAVLSKNDQMQQIAGQNYREQETETVQRTRGIQ